eukprot:Amastigsp_a352471_4.p3 type:complete len:119 gc:universal Amastigsp_a352471_4:366-722(+)
MSPIARPPTLCACCCTPSAFASPPSTSRHLSRCARSAARVKQGPPRTPSSVTPTRRAPTKGRRSRPRRSLAAWQRPRARNGHRAARRRPEAPMRPPKPAGWTKSSTASKASTGPFWGL